MFEGLDSAISARLLYGSSFAGRIANRIPYLMRVGQVASLVDDLRLCDLLASKGPSG